MSREERLLGIDYGRARIGLALSDAESRIAFPHSTYTRQSLAQDLDYLAKVVAEGRVDRVVLGLPLHLNDNESAASREVKEFGTVLQAKLTVPVVYWDERFTTVEAEGFLWNAGLSHKKRKARRDRVAAQILLQSYLDAGSPDEAGETS